MYLGDFVGQKEGRETEKKMLNSAKGLISPRRREKNDISFSFYIVYFGEKTCTANFAQSAENNVDPFFKNSDRYIGAKMKFRYLKSGEGPGTRLGAGLQRTSRNPDPIQSEISLYPRETVGRFLLNVIVRFYSP